MIRMALQDREPAIQLLQQHYARQLMWQGDLPERHDVLCFRARRIRPPIRRADGKQQVLRSVRKMIIKEISDLFRSQLLAARIQQHQQESRFPLPEPGWRWPAPAAGCYAAPAGRWCSRRSARSRRWQSRRIDRKSTRLNSSHLGIAYAVF